MELPKTLVDTFVKNTSDVSNKIQTSNILYGTAININGQIYVKIDGSESLIPVVKAVDAESGDRVTITIDNHKAVLTGNITNPASLKKIKAEEGYIGGYVITNDQIYNTAGGYKKCVGIGTPNIGWAFYAGANSKDDISNALFRVGHDGKLYATDAILNGSLITESNQFVTHIHDGFIALESKDHYTQSQLTCDRLRLQNDNGVVMLDPSGSMIDLSDHTFDLYANYITLRSNNTINLGGTTVANKIEAESLEYNGSELKDRFADKYHDHWYLHSGCVVGCSSTNHFRSYKDDGSATADNSVYCGSTNVRWIRLYAANSSIGTSDERMKEDIKEYDERYEKLFELLKPISYKWKNDGSDNRTNHDRTHTGFIAQQVKEAMDEVGLTPIDFAAFCYDDFTADPEWTSESTNGMTDRYSLAYGEFISLNTHMIQKTMKENRELQNRVDALEQQMKEITILLNKKGEN